MGRCRGNAPAVRAVAAPVVRRMRRGTDMRFDTGRGWVFAQALGRWNPVQEGAIWVVYLIVRILGRVALFGLKHGPRIFALAR